MLPVLSLRRLPQTWVRSIPLRYYTTPKFTNQAEESIYNKLKENLKPEELTVKDISGGCGAMYQIKIGASAFQGMGLVAQHRKVNEILSQELQGMHGLQLDTYAVKQK
ncbi:hypothetical protein IWQ62_002072 [Dispira parvispora]|uniref:BolA family transcriptional regulator n=1 Tax=Dispira parvispora TaxID=1520584 RepID=A0A9W8AXJ4_9FUNG|nr:hypothetical protein IWQ62_002072 [Dispira parvispora]